MSVRRSKDPPALRIVLADDHAMVRRALKAWLGQDDDKDLTPEGKAKRERIITATFLEKVKPLDAAVSKFNDRVTAMFGEITKKAAFPKPTDPADRIEHVLRLQEVRHSLATLDSTGRMLAYLPSTNPFVMEAIESAPPPLQVMQKGAMPSRLH